MSKQAQFIRFLKYRYKEGNTALISGEKLKMCIDALEKQKAKRPYAYFNGSLHCPNCDYDNTALRFKVCVECGQKLLWEDDTE